MSNDAVSNVLRVFDTVLGLGVWVVVDLMWCVGAGKIVERGGRVICGNGEVVVAWLLIRRQLLFNLRVYSTCCQNPPDGNNKSR